MSAKLNEIGNRYGRLLVLGESIERYQKSYCWVCVCDCGKVVVIQGSRLRRGNVASCGCLRRDLLSERQTKHGLARPGAKHPIYLAWQEAKRRCACPTRKQTAQNYALRGIKFLLGDPLEFFGRMKSTWFEGATLERVDNDGHYEYANIRWATRREQSRNKRNNVWITFRGETMIAKDWANRLGITQANLIHRIKKWPLDLALTVPNQGKRHVVEF